MLIIFRILQSEASNQRAAALVYFENRDVPALQGFLLYKSEKCYETDTIHSVLQAVTVYNRSRMRLLPTPAQMSAGLHRIAFPAEKGMIHIISSSRETLYHAQEPPDKR